MTLQTLQTKLQLGILMISSVLLIIVTVSFFLFWKQLLIMRTPHCIIWVTCWYGRPMKMFTMMLLWAMRTCERLLTGLSEKSSNYDELAGYWFLDEFLSCLGSIIVLIHSSSVSTGNSLWYYTMPLYHYTI